MFIGVGNPIPRIANLPGASRPGSGGGGGGGGLDQVENLYSYEFNGVGSAFTIPNNSAFNLGTAFTISGWFNFTSNKYQGLISFDNNPTRGWFLFQISTSNDIKLFDGTTSVTLKSSYTTTNQWDHFAVTYNGTNVVFYINGVQQTTQAASLDLQTNGNDGAIGNNQFAAGRFFNGYMDEIALFNTALSATTVQNIYNATTTGKTADLSSLSPVAWYRMGD